MLRQEALRHLHAQEPALEAHVDELNAGLLVVPAAALTAYVAVHLSQALPRVVPSVPGVALSVQGARKSVEAGRKRKGGPEGEERWEEEEEGGEGEGEIGDEQVRSAGEEARISSSLSAAGSKRVKRAGAIGE